MLPTTKANRSPPPVSGAVYSYTHLKIELFTRLPTNVRKDAWGSRTAPHASILVLTLLRSWYWHGREWRNAADGRCARRKRRRSRDQGVVTLRRSRTSRHAHAGVRIDVRIRSCEAVRERLEEGHDLVLLRIRQAEHANCQDRKSTRLNSSHGYISY